MTYINHIKMVQLLITLPALYFPGLMFIQYFMFHRMTDQDHQGLKEPKDIEDLKEIL